MRYKANPGIRRASIVMSSTLPEDDMNTSAIALQPPRWKRLVLIVVIYLAFISLGLPDGVHGLAWPGMRLALGQPVEALGLVTFVLACCSAVSGFISGRVLARFNTGPVTFASALITGLAILGFSQVTSFPMMVALAFPLGLGAGSVDAGLNNFVAEHYSSRHMNWLHACWGVGATLGPSIVGAVLASGGNWSSGYLAVACGQLFLALVLFASLGLWKHQAPAHHHAARADESGRADAPALAAALSALLFALYVSIEMGTGWWAGVIMIEGRGFEPGMAGLAVTLFFGSIMGGRILIGFVSNRLGNRRLIRTGLIVAIAGLALLLIPDVPALALLGLGLFGFGCAPVYPGLMHETPRRFDPVTARKVIGWQVAAAGIGAAVMPATFGVIAAHFGMETVFPVIFVLALVLLGLSIRLDQMTPVATKANN